MTITEQATRVRDYAQRGMENDKVSASVRCFMRDAFEIADFLLQQADSEFSHLPPYPAKPRDTVLPLPPVGGIMVRYYSTDEATPFRPTSVAGLHLVGPLQTSDGRNVSVAIHRNQAVDPAAWDAAYRAIAGELPTLIGPDGEEIDPQSVAM